MARSSIAAPKVSDTMAPTPGTDISGIAQLMRLGWFRPVHCKSVAAQATRARSPRASWCR
jgi:hypothetical protein